LPTTTQPKILAKQMATGIEEMTANKKKNVKKNYLYNILIK
jgi:hypothetical protein